MVEERALAGKKALGAWFHRCRTELGDIGVGVFRKLMASLVESTMLYEAEIWECNRDLEKMEQNQVRALRLFFGVGTLFFFFECFTFSGDEGPTGQVAGKDAGCDILG